MFPPVPFKLFCKKKCIFTENNQTREYLATLNVHKTNINSGRPATRSLKPRRKPRQTSANEPSERPSIPRAISPSSQPYQTTLNLDHSKHFNYTAILRFLRNIRPLFLDREQRFKRGKGGYTRRRAISRVQKETTTSLRRVSKRSSVGGKNGR